MSIILWNCTSNDIEKSDSKTIIVASEKRSCQGITQLSCFLIKEKENDSWEFFYNEIKGFDYEEGFEYKLLVSEKEINPVPADASSIETTLIRIISKEEKTSSNLP
ncbi:hypothetical protein WH52_04885 [Tenacibaculum holothuriorum]|uniref:DUF4377 domain-containing protein n=2 Tax=Tenacibaculum holothuriorum TaxID=1635173 RepID=A0A1Y2PH05_9FLAO|nr:hypothetical protein WH52_04885 [Tenacibaculum holothuriorum]